MHVVVAGGGIFGQVIAWRLALRGARVTLVEPIGPGAAGSGSGDRSRIVRALYDEPFFAEAGFLGLRLWDEWQAQLGARLVEKIGVVYLVRRDGPGASAFRNWVAKGTAHVRALGGAIDELTPAEMSRRWQAMTTSDLESGAFEPAAGYGRPALAARTIARAAAATGLVTHVAASAVGIEETSGRVRALRVRAPGASAETRVAADAVVVAAGLAGVDLVEPLCGRLPIERLAHWTAYWDVPYPEGAALHQSVLPAWADLGAELYGFPDDGESGFKAAFHAPRPATSTRPAPAFPRSVPPPAPSSPRSVPPPGSPRSVPPPGSPRSVPPPAGLPSSRHSLYSDPPADAPSETELEILRERVALRFPALARAHCRGTYACAYDSTADERFQIGPVPGLLGLWFVGGMSGHGFKHAPGLGESVAASVLGEPPLLDLSPYSLRVPSVGRPLP